MKYYTLNNYYKNVIQVCLDNTILYFQKSTGNLIAMKLKNVLYYHYKTKNCNDILTSYKNSEIEFKPIETLDLIQKITSEFLTSIEN